MLTRNRKLLLSGAAGVALIGAVVAYQAGTGGASEQNGPPAEVFETVKQADIVGGFDGALWLETVDESDDLLSASEAMERYAAAYPNIDGDFPMRESPKLVRFRSAIGHDGQPMERNPELVDRPLWAVVLDTGVERTDAGLAPGEVDVHVIFLDAKTGEIVMGVQREGIPAEHGGVPGRVGD